MPVYLLWPRGDDDVVKDKEAKGQPAYFRAAYATLEEAQAQGDHNFARGQHGQRIEDADGKVLSRKFSKPKA